MPILERFRNLLRRRPGPLPFEQAPADTASTRGTQAEHLADAVFAVGPDAVVEETPPHDAATDPAAECEIEPASHILADTSHYARLEPKAVSTEVLSPEEFSRTTDQLSEGLNQLRAQLVLQAGRLDALAHSLDRLRDAVQDGRGPDVRVDQLEDSVTSFLAQQAETTAAVDALRAQILSWRDHTDSRLDATGQSIDDVSGRLINLQKQQLGQAEQLKSQEGSIQQLGQRFLSLEHTQRGAVGSLEQAISRQAAEVANLDRRTSSMRNLLVLATVASVTAALLGLVALIGG